MTRRTGHHTTLAAHVNVVSAASLVVMLLSEALTIARVEPFCSWNTPICWSAFIVFADGIVFRARGRSLIRSTPGEFALLALLSIPLWVMFEGYNQIIRNWYYVGLPENWWLRMFGYAWSFSTIWPAIFEGADLIGVARGPGGVGGSSWPRRAGAWSIAAGAAMLVAPFLVPRDAARYMAAPVWLGFIFLLDPVNERLGGATLVRDWNRTINLLLSGLLCGVLWEFWNYWSAAKWHYTVPIMENLKVFEMPLPGYLGFPPFALECFTMFVFVRLMFGRLAS